MHRSWVRKALLYSQRRVSERRASSPPNLAIFPPGGIPAAGDRSGLQVEVRTTMRMYPRQRATAPGGLRLPPRDSALPTLPRRPSGPGPVPAADPTRKLCALTGRRSAPSERIMAWAPSYSVPECDASVGVWPSGSGSQGSGCGHRMDFSHWPGVVPRFSCGAVPGKWSATPTSTSARTSPPRRELQVSSFDLCSRSSSRRARQALTNSSARSPN
ncbi:hypothetical protein BV20DRAFT_236378 [Pilatotrama ljubarskyi]|nr:hypothetical protein BV20DRAFT_236378 [Pilatotrama ljubarskyi]